MVARVPWLALRFLSRWRHEARREIRCPWHVLVLVRFCSTHCLRVAFTRDRAFLMGAMSHPDTSGDRPIPAWVTEPTGHGAGGHSYIHLDGMATGQSVETKLEWEPDTGTVMRVLVSGSGVTDEVWLQPAQARFVAESLTKLLAFTGDR